jgi:dTDP-4-dehydrorhamnose reductase
VSHRVVVIGREGQVARALARHLPSLGMHVSILARPEHDLVLPDTLVAAIIAARPDVVINAAAYTAVDTAEDEVELAYSINATAAGAVAAAAGSVGAPIIHFSTDYVFDGTKPTPYLEADAVHPLSVYGASKLAGERLVAAANPAHVILRTAWVCGPDGQNFLKTMLRLGAERARLRVVDDQHGAPTFAADLAVATGAIVAALARPKREIAATAPEYGVFHCVSSGSTTWCGFARAIMAGATARGFGAMAQVDAISTAEYPTKANRPAQARLATQKLAAAYGIQMPEWQASLAACLDGQDPRTGNGRQ